MYLIQNVTEQSLQNNTFVLPDGTSLNIQIYFRPMQYGWFINSLSYASKSFALNGIRVTNSPNILRQWKNQIPFGLACYSTQNREPQLQQDFLSGASKLYLLTQIEVQQYEQLLEGVPFWVPTNNYSAGFLVTYQGRVYESLVQPNIGKIPSSSPVFWKLYA